MTKILSALKRLLSKMVDLASALKRLHSKMVDRVSALKNEEIKKVRKRPHLLCRICEKKVYQHFNPSNQFQRLMPGHLELTF